MTKKQFYTFLLIAMSYLSFAQENYLGEIRLFAGNFAPVGWEFCKGQLLSIAANDALFALLGTTYGGNGQTTFGVPDLRGRVPVGTGSANGIALKTLGAPGGQEQVSLTNSSMPNHGHGTQIQVSNANATLATPTATSTIATAGNMSGRILRQNLNYNTETPNTTIQTITTSDVGTNQAIDIVKPYLGLNYIISLFGIYPTAP